MVQPKNFYEMTLPELKDYLVGMGAEGFRSQQLFRWIYGERITDFSKMSNMSKKFREELPAMLDLSLPKIVTELKSQDGTRKYLFDMGQGNTVEAVLIPSEDRLTLCVSSEIGCNMACQFCFTAKQKLKRRLTAGEIVGQFMQVTDRLRADFQLGAGANNTTPEPPRITNIVFMGMGEPLDNPDAVFKSVEILHDSFGMNVSRKRVTISTSGLVPQIPLVAKSKTRLAVSLNAVDNETRNKIMPINKKYPIEQLLEACAEYYKETGDRITFEYVLLKDVTDKLEDAKKLYHLTKHIPCKINIIPFNEHPQSGFKRPEDMRIHRFQQELMNLGAHVLRRKTMGRDIYAACGQLNSVYKEQREHL